MNILSDYINMHALLLEKLLIEIKYYCEPLYLKLYFKGSYKGVHRCIFTSFTDKLMYMYYYVYICCIRFCVIDVILSYICKVAQ